jgi:hypothetical protein
MSVEGPPDETEYYLYEDYLPSEQYDEIARRVTAAVLEVSPRAVAEIRVWGIMEWLRETDEEAVDTLIDGGITYEESSFDLGTLRGRCSATPAIIEAVLSLYNPGLWHAHFFDEKGFGISARYDDSLQHYWLPKSAFFRLNEKLEPEVHTALVTMDKLDELHQRNREDHR